MKSLSLRQLDSAFATAPEWLPGNTIMLTCAGSHLYGTATPTSDIDIRGVAIAPLEHHFGFADRFEDYSPEDKSEVDIVIYDLRKFAKLCAGGNPNVLELLFAPTDDMMRCTEWWRVLREHRHRFLSRKVENTFAGYAVSQLHKLRTGKANGNRGAAREELLQTYGYDTKNAMHLVRLLRSGIGVLETGNLNPFRQDAEELLAIRNGAWSLERVEAYANLKLVELREAAAKTPLPEVPDTKKLNRLVVDLVRDFLIGGAPTPQD